MPCMKYTIRVEVSPTVRYLKMRSPPASSAKVFIAATRTLVFPSKTSSRCVYGQADASPQFKDHQIVSRNK